MQAGESVLEFFLWVRIDSGQKEIHVVHILVTCVAVVWHQRSSHLLFVCRLSNEPEEDLYLQCDLPDDAIYSNDPACHLSHSQEEDVYIVPDSWSDTSCLQIVMLHVLIACGLNGHLCKAAAFGSSWPENKICIYTQTCSHIFVNMLYCCLCSGIKSLASNNWRSGETIMENEYIFLFLAQYISDSTK